MTDPRLESLLDQLGRGDRSPAIGKTFESGIDGLKLPPSSTGGQPIAGPQIKNSVVVAHKEDG